MVNGMVRFRQDRCKGCGVCMANCPQQIIAPDAANINARGYHPARVLDESRCTGCASCAIMCPDAVISVYRQ